MEKPQSWTQQTRASDLFTERLQFSTKLTTMAIPPRSSLLLFVLINISVVTAFPQSHIRPLQRNSPQAGQEESKQEQWEVLYPSISLHDWSIQMLSAPEFGGVKHRLEPLGVNDWMPLSQSQMEDELVKEWQGNWPQRVGNQEKRNIVVADDAAFREKSKLLTAMERQKWLNSYMQKLLVVNSK